MRSIDGIAKAMGGAQVNKQSVLVVGATGTLGRQVGMSATVVVDVTDDRCWISSCPEAHILQSF